MSESLQLQPGPLQPGQERFDLQYSSEGIDIGAFRARPEHAWQTRPRHARYFHVAVVRRGAMARMVKNEPVVSTPGAGRLIWGDEEFGFTQPLESESLSTGIYFDPDLFIETLSQVGCPAIGARGELMRSRHFQLASRDHVLFWELAARLERAGAKSDEALAIEELAMLVASAAMRSACEIAGAPPRPSRLKNPRRVANEVRALLAEQYAGPLTLDSIANHVHLSPFHLCRQFRRETGSTIHQELERIRLCAAMEVMKDGADNLETIAHCVGYSTRGHFGARFKRAFALTPTAFKKSVLGCPDPAQSITPNSNPECR